MQIKNSPHRNNLVAATYLFAMLQLSSNAYAGEPSTLGNNNVIINHSNTSNSASSISDIYSDIDMRVRLSTKASTSACYASQCDENHAFDVRVAAMGRYLSKAAVQLYPNQEQLIQRMTFSVVDKQEAGTASNNKGQIVLLRGVQNLQLSDDALGFVIAREMSHVLAGHHKTNTSTKLIISALASILFPAVAIIGASSAAAQASTATTLLNSAASTATSMLGGEVAIAKMKPTQLSQADEMACNIMQKVEWDMRSAQSVLMQAEPVKSAWMLDLENSRAHLANKVEKEDAEIIALEDNLTATDSANLQLDDFQSLEDIKNVEDIVLKSVNTQETELDGVKINPMQANTSASPKASLDNMP